MNQKVLGTTARALRLATAWPWHSDFGVARVVLECQVEVRKEDVTFRIHHDVIGLYIALLYYICGYRDTRVFRLSIAQMSIPNELASTR
jgi:hypothetical protein